MVFALAMRRKISVVMVAAMVAPFIGLASAPAQGPTPLLTNVSISNTGDFDEVVFTFAGTALPTVDGTVKDPPFYNTAGDVVTVPGSSFFNVRMFPASGVDFGLGCSTTDPTPGVGETLVGVYFSCVDGLNGPAPAVRTGRAVPSGTPDAVLASTFDQLLAGPSPADATAGLTSLFSSATTGLLLSASIAPDGTATIDFDPTLATTIPNASSSAGSDELLRELDATVFQFSGITAATYTLGGSCTAFFNWLQRACAPRVPDDGAAAQYAVTYNGPTTVTGPSSNVTQAVQLEDFEAQLTWVIGLRTQTDVTVTTATSPARVIVRVAHAVVTAQPRFTG
jgi:hypothetical protein